MELEDWIRGMGKTFIVGEVPDEKNVNIGKFCLTEEADIWWNAMKDRLSGLHSLGINSCKNCKPNITQ